MLTLNGYPALIDAQILMELSYIGIDGSARWIADLERCRTDWWLLPRHERPFALISYYDSHQLFTDEFRRAFTDHYRVLESSEHFDIWACRHTPG